MDYYKRPEWSYSQMKVILDSGIDYAVAKKRGMLPEPSSSAIDLGQLIHQRVLGGDDEFVLSSYDNYRTKEARAWRDEQIANGKIVISKTDAENANLAVGNVISHPHTSEYLVGDNAKHEVELYAKTADGVDIRGKADAIIYGENGKPRIICDIKTTSQFDKFFRSAYSHHYDLQAAVYTMIAGTDMVNYYFCVVETVAPYRVQYMHASLEFMESGERKFRRCIDEILAFGDKEPDFKLTEVKELGDYSL